MDNIFIGEHIKVLDNGKKFVTYEFECTLCGEHYFRCSKGKHINCYCNKCYKRIERIKQKERSRKKEISLISQTRIDLIHEIRRRCVYYDVFEVLDQLENEAEHINR